MGPFGRPLAAEAPSPTAVAAAGANVAATGPVQHCPAPAQEMLHGAAVASAAAAVLILAVTVAGCVPDAPRADAPGREAAPPRVVAVVAAQESEDAATRALESGLSVEVGHWLSHASDVVVREGDAGAAHVVRLGLESAGEGWVARWEVVAPGGSSVLDSTAVTPERIARLPRALALQVFADVSSDAEARGALEGARDPSPADAYVAFLRLLGAELGGAAGAAVDSLVPGAAAPTGDEKVRRLVAQTAALDSVVARLSDAPAAELELGSEYLELAGLSPGDAPYYDLAGQHLSRAVELDPGLPSAREELALYNTKLGRSKEALALLAEGIARNPSYAGFHDARGYLLRYAGWTSESIASYLRAQELDPRPANLVSTQDQITKSHIYLGEYAEALASHERVESLLEELGRAATEKEHFYEGVIHLYADDRDAALASFREGRAVDPGTVWSIFGEGYEGIALGDRDRVKDVLERLEALGVVDGERHYRLVHFAAFLDEPERALEHLEYSIGAGFFASPYFEADPLMESLRSHPGFPPLLARAAARHDAFLGDAPSGDHDDGK